MNRPRYVFIMPDGTEHHGIDQSYCGGIISIGDKLILEDQKDYYIVRDVQHQFREVGIDGQLLLKQIMTIVILGWNTT